MKGINQKIKNVHEILYGEVKCVIEALTLKQRDL